MAHDGDIVFQQQFHQMPECRFVHGTQTKRVADRHPALKPQPFGPLGDLFQIERTQLTGFVQMNIDSAIVSFRQPEDGIELSFRIAVDRRGVESAHHLGAHAQSFFDQLEGSGPDQQTALRKRDDLDRNRGRQIVTRAQHAFQTRQSDIGIDIDKSAHVGRPSRDHPLDGPCRLLARIDPPFDSQPPLVVDHLLDTGPDLVAIPSETQQTLVDMRVRIDEPRKEHSPPAIDRFALAHQYSSRLDRFDRTSVHQQIGPHLIRHGQVAQQHRASFREMLHCGSYRQLGDERATGRGRMAERW